MEAFVGKWEFVSATNQESLMDAVGMTNPQQRAMFVKIRPTWSVEGTGEGWTVTQCTPQRTVTYTFTLGNEFEHDTLDGRRMKTIVTVEGGVITEVHTDAANPEGSPHVTRRLEGDAMKCVMKIRGVQSELTFQKLA